MFRKRRKRDLRLFFTSDIHGSDVCFRKFLAAGPTYEANVLILGGDLTGKGVVPIVERSSEHYVARFQGTHHDLPNAAALVEFEAKVKHNGFYSARMSAAEYERVSDSKTAQAELFTEVMRRQIREWMSLADARLDGTDTICTVMLGNDDEPALASEIEASERVGNSEDGIVSLPGGYELVSCGFSNMTPWRSPRELTEEELSSRLETLIAAVRNSERAIFNFHVPPFNSGLDTVPELDSSFRPVVRGGNPSMIPAGSTAVRDAILEHQPPLALHGHIHETRGAQRLGQTLAINPGSDYASGKLDGVIVDLDQDGVIASVFTRG